MITYASYIGRLAVLLILLTGCTAKVISTKATSTFVKTKPELDGLYYALPRTVLTVEVPITLTTYTDGPFFKYADLFFPGTSSRSTKLALGEVKLSSRGELDPEQVFVMRGSGRGALAQTLTFNYSESGTVTGIKADVTNNTLDIVLSGISAGANILTRTVFAGGGDETDSGITCGSKTDYQISQLVNTEQRKYFIKCVLVGTSRSIKTQQLIGQFLDLSLSRQSTLVGEYYNFSSTGELRSRSLRRAFEQYSEIAVLLAGRSKLLSTPDLANFDPTETLKMSEAAETVLRKAFQQIPSKAEWTAMIDVRMSDCRTKSSSCTNPVRYELISYVPNTTLCDINPNSMTELVNSGSSIPAKLKPGPCGGATQTVEIVMKPAQSEQLAWRLDSQYKTPDPAALYYIIPLNMNVTIENGGQKLVQSVLQIAQRGVVMAMPSDLGGKGVVHDVQYYGNTGALKSYVLTTKAAVEKGNIDSLGTVANTILDARNSKKEAEANADFNALKRASETADLQLKLQKACAELTNPLESCEGL